MLFSTQTNLLCSIININWPLHSQDFYRNQFPLSSSTHTHHANKAQEMHKTQETHISNREGKSHRVEKQSMGLLCFFHINQTICFVWFSVKKTQQTRFLGKMGLGLLCMGCCVWVCSVWFMGKMQGLWFSMDGLLGEEIGKETGPKGAFSFRKKW